MPQLTKGGKWVFGWTVVGPQREIVIPPEAYEEYGFQVGDEVIFLRGSRRSGGFSLGQSGRVPVLLEKRVLGRDRLAEDGQAKAPVEANLQPGARLVVVRGSGYALGFFARGPIYEEALRHAELEVFDG